MLPFDCTAPTTPKDAISTGSIMYHYSMLHDAGSTILLAISRSAITPEPWSTRAAPAHRGTAEAQDAGAWSA